MAFSVIVPVHDEASLLPETVPRLLAGLPPDTELVFVCNGCRDASPALIRALAGDRARLLVLPQAGKTAAMRAGEAAVSAFPVFYLDADVWVDGATVAALAATLDREGLELVSPRLVPDTRGAGRLARGVTEVWTALPHMRVAGFHNLLGLSRAGRARFGAIPDVRADDDYMAAHVPQAARRVVGDCTAVIRPPRSLASWIRVRARWASSQRELRRLGATAPATPGQLSALWSMAVAGRGLDVAAYAAVRGLAPVLAWRERGGWYRDDSSRI